MTVPSSTELQNYTFTAIKGSLELSRLAWDPQMPLSFELAFETRSYSGQIAFILGSVPATAVTRFELGIHMDRRQLRVFLKNSVGKLTAHSLTGEQTFSFQK